MNKKEARTAGFRMLPSYYEAIRNLPDDARLKLYDAVCDFGFGNDPPELDALTAAFFLLMRPTLEKSIRYFEKQKENSNKELNPLKNI